LKLDESCISDPKSEISDWTADTQQASLRQKVQSAVSNFGFEVQDSSNFKFPVSPDFYRNPISLDRRVPHALEDAFCANTISAAAVRSGPAAALAISRRATFTGAGGGGAGA